MSDNTTDENSITTSVDPNSGHIEKPKVDPVCQPGSTSTHESACVTINPTSLDYKAKMMIRILEVAHNARVKNVSQVAMIRAWSLAFLAAYTTFVSSRKPPNFGIILLSDVALIGVLGYFMWLEAMERKHMKMRLAQMESIEEIFMGCDEGQFIARIRDYRFPDLPRSKKYKERSCKRKLRYSWRVRRSELLFAPVYVWYGFFAVLTVMIGFTAWRSPRRNLPEQATLRREHSSKQIEQQHDWQTPSSDSVLP